MRPELEVQQLTYWYPDAARPALSQLDWQLTRGEFVLLVGPSGCGKSTLLRTFNGLVPEFYGGQIAGTVRYRGQVVRDLGRGIARHVGMVFQDPERQLVMSEVEREIAFGLENIQVPQAEMRRRVAEIMAFFDLTRLRHKRTTDLSGGEKQKVALAAVMALQPDVLLLDEPTSQLDPGSAQEILDLVKRMHEELGLTVVLVEQRLDRVLHLADRVVAMHEGVIEYDGSPAGFAHHAAEVRPELLAPVTKLFAAAGLPERPLTVRDARLAVAAYVEGATAPAPVAPEPAKLPARMKEALTRLFRPAEPGSEAMYELRQVRFAYEGMRDVLKGLDLVVPKGRMTALLGANGTGKSTLLRHLVALHRAQEGKVLLEGQDLGQRQAEDLAGTVGYLSQNPGDYLFHDTLKQECEFSRELAGLSVGDAASEQAIEDVLTTLGLLAHRDHNPRDLSGGERQRAALATVLVQHPRVLLLDEPTRGLDSGQKDTLGSWLHHYVAEGGTVVLITHDIEFAAEYAEQVVLLDDGQVVATGSPQEMLTRGLFYTPQVARVFRGVNNSIVTLAAGVERLTAARPAGTRA